MPTQRVYKVVRKVTTYGNGLMSVGRHGGNYNVTYHPRKVTRPRLKNSLLFAFSDLSSAQDFKIKIGEDEDIEIWEADAEGVCALTIGSDATFFYKGFWELGEKGFEKLTRCTIKLPENTVGCQTIKITSRAD